MKIVLIFSRIDAHAGVVLDLIQEYKLFDVVGFIDDNPDLIGKKIKDIPLIGKTSEISKLIKPDIDGFFICSGSNTLREKFYNILTNNKFNAVNVIHPSAVISKSATIGNGVFIGANVSVTHNVKIGNGVLINTSSIIEHDNIIEDFANICPGCHTSGRVIIKKNAFLGTGVTVIPDIIIGENSIIGAGSVVIKDIEANTTVAGNPAHRIK